MATILIAEDYDDNRELLRLLLRRKSSGPRSKERVGVSSPRAAESSGLIMVDLSMPGLDGWEVFRELKADSSTATFRVWPSRPTPIRIAPARCNPVSATLSVSRFAPKNYC